MPPMGKEEDVIRAYLSRGLPRLALTPALPAIPGGGTGLLTEQHHQTYHHHLPHLLLLVLVRLYLVTAVLSCFTTLHQKSHILRVLGDKIFNIVISSSGYSDKLPYFTI